MEHREEGSLGFLLNRTADLDFDELREQLDLGESSHIRAPELPVLLGGPVMPEQGWVLFEAGPTLLSTLESEFQEGTVEDGDGLDGSLLKVDERVCVSPNLDVLAHLCGAGAESLGSAPLGSAPLGDGPLRAVDNRYLLLLGYAGWAPGQLDQEMAEGSWLAVDFQEDLVFDVPLEERWETALAHLGIHAGQVSVGVPGLA